MRRKLRILVCPCVSCTLPDFGERFVEASAARNIKVSEMKASDVKASDIERAPQHVSLPSTVQDTPIVPVEPVYPIRACTGFLYPYGRRNTPRIDIITGVPAEQRCTETADSSA